MVQWFVLTEGSARIPGMTNVGLLDTAEVRAQGKLAEREESDLSESLLGNDLNIVMIPRW